MRRLSRKIIFNISKLFAFMSFPIGALAEPAATHAQLSQISENMNAAVTMHMGYVLLAMIFIVISFVWYLVDLILFCTRKVKKIDKKTRIRGATTLLVLAILSAHIPFFIAIS